MIEGAGEQISYFFEMRPLHLSDFEQSDEVEVVRCPLGHSIIESTRKEGRFVVRFDIWISPSPPAFLEKTPNIAVIL